jgi:hypothetical protein
MVDCTGYIRLLAPSFLTGVAEPHALSLRSDFITEHPEYVALNNAMNYLSDNGGTDYNLCHCTSNSP